MGTRASCARSGAGSNAPGSAARAWQAGRRRFVSKVLGPHFEQVCRDWALHHADPVLPGGLPALVGHGVVHDPKARICHEVDVAVIGIADAGRPPLLAIGDAKWNDTASMAHIDRIRHIRTSRAAAEAEPEIQLIDPATHYGQV
ncbi:hypothetical protein [Streptomyces sp. NPDC001492]